MFGSGLKLIKGESAPLVCIGTSRIPSMPSLSPVSGTESKFEMETEIFYAKDIKNECFQWGNGVKILEKPKLLRGKQIISVRSGGSHAVALLDTGQVYSWGEGRCGQLGHGKALNLEQPTLIEGFDEPVVSIFAGFTQSAFITESGKLYICGLIGNDIEYTPEVCLAMDNVLVKDISFGPSCIGMIDLW